MPTEAMPVQSTNSRDFDSIAFSGDFSYRDKPIFDFFKRLFDIVLSALLIILLSPLFLLFSVIIKLSDGGSVFYVTTRMGKNGKSFEMIKFRSMKMNADSLSDMLSEEEYQNYKINFKLKNDPRVTKLGRIMRKASIDELPQLFNIFCGNMSFIGPRPVLDEETRLYGFYRDTLLKVKPGLTGYWQAYGRDTVFYQDGERQKMELSYVRNRSVLLDLKIIFRTFYAVFTGKGAS